MEMLLMIVTVVALALAIGMATVAWRLIRENRWRSAARSETLQALAADDDEPEERFTTLDDYQPEVTFAATVARPEAAPKRRWLALAIVAVLMAALVSAVYTLYRPVIAAEATRAADSSAPAPAASAGPHPLELLSLRHAAEPDGTFTVTGLVQNPAGGAPFRKVIAVVYLFDRDGNYFAGGKAGLDFATLQPGDESPFVVHVQNAAHVSRYRVGFRYEDGGIVAHVDRRGQLPGSTTGNATDAGAAHAPATRRSEGRP